MAIELISTIKPKNNGRFPMVEAPDVAVGNSQRLDDVLPTVYGDVSGAVSPITLLTQEEYDALVEGGTLDENRLYLIYEEESP